MWFLENKSTFVGVCVYLTCVWYVEDQNTAELEDGVVFTEGTSSL